MNRTQATTNLERVRAFRDRSVVGQLPLIVGGMRLAHLRSTTRKCFLYRDCRNGVVGILKSGVVLKLESRFVDNCLVDDGCFSQLNTLLGVRSVVGAGRQ